MWLLFLILGSWILVYWFGLYFLIPWVDIPLHFFGGLWVYVFARYLAMRFDLEINSQFPVLAKFIIFIGAVFFVGVFWEFWEFVLDRYLIHSGYSLLLGVYEDTLKDLFMDFLGGAFGFIFIKYD